MFVKQRLVKYVLLIGTLALLISGTLTWVSSRTAVHAAMAPHAAARYSVSDLTALSHDTAFQGTSLNTSAQVAGSGNEFGASRPFRATPGAFEYLGTLGNEGIGTGINTAGQIVGQSTGLFGSPPDQSHAFLWTPDSGFGTMTDLGSLGGGNSSATAINTAGAVVGSSTGTDAVSYPFLWLPATPNNATTGTMHNLSVAGVEGTATGLNNRHEIVGNVTVAGTPHATLWVVNAQGQVLSRTDLNRQLTFAGAQGSQAAQITDAGVVTGTVLLGFTYHAFVWTPRTPNGMTGTAIDLGTLGGLDSNALGINQSTQVVGSAKNTNGDDRAFVWCRSTGLIDLNTRIPINTGLTLIAAKAINDAGQILADVQVAGLPPGQTHTVLLTPQA